MPARPTLADVLGAEKKTRSEGQSSRPERVVASGGGQGLHPWSLLLAFASYFMMGCFRACPLGIRRGGRVPIYRTSVSQPARRRLHSVRQMLSLQHVKRRQNAHQVHNVVTSHYQ